MQECPYLNNFCVHKGAWGGQAADIMSGWKVEGNMELEYPRYPFDFQAIDERYKIADSIKSGLSHCRLLASG